MALFLYKTSTCRPTRPRRNPLLRRRRDPDPHTTIRDVWQLERKTYDKLKNMNRALADRFLSLPQKSTSVHLSPNSSLPTPKLPSYKSMNDSATSTGSQQKKKPSKTQQNSSATGRHMREWRSSSTASTNVWHTQLLPAKKSPTT